MVEQFKNLSSWREDNITINANGVYTVTFLDTKPNMFYILNQNPAKLKVSISKLPRNNEYEFLITENSAMPFGRPLPTGQLYIYNTSDKEITVKLYSIYEKFDLNILKNFNITGFEENASLPEGSNNIGSVDLGESTKEFLNGECSDILAELYTIKQKLSNIETVSNNILDNMEKPFSSMAKSGTYTASMQSSTIVTKDKIDDISLYPILFNKIIRLEFTEVTEPCGYLTLITENVSNMALANGISIKPETGKIYENLNIPIYGLRLNNNGFSGSYKLNVLGGIY